MSVLALVATIPARRHSCERVLDELARQGRPPDGVILVLDGYGESPSPRSSIPITLEVRTKEMSGAGNRWRAVKDLPLDDVVICVDDDVMLFQAPGFVDSLARTVEGADVAAGAMGRTVHGDQAPPCWRSCGSLLHAAGCGLTARAKHLAGIGAFADEVKVKGGPDALGRYGDDDALVSAFLWVQGVKIIHAPTGNVFEAPGMAGSSTTDARRQRGEDMDAQKRAIAKVTGWPWPVTQWSV